MPTVFHDRITRDGASGFKAESGRYHLYISLGCPWAHRTALLWKLKGLENVILKRISREKEYWGDRI
jgi:glutathionyl-hydroquinone reductase